MQVYKSVDTVNNNPAFIGIITRTSILSLISLFSTIIDASFVLIVPNMQSMHLLMVSRIAVILDLSCNFWCVILAYSGYQQWYLKLCGYWDSKCTECWHKIVKKQSNDQSRELSEKPKVIEAHSTEFTDFSSE